MLPGQHRHRGRRSRPRFGLLGLGAGGGFLAAVAIAAVGLAQVAGGQACAAVVSDRAAVVSDRAAVVSGGAAGGTGSQIATHYVLQGLPNCSYPSLPSDGLFVALPPADYASAAACGGYLEVTGPHGSVRVKVIDQCPDCAAGHIDLSETAFAALAPLSDGLISVSYSSLADPPLPGPVSVEVKQGSSRYWLALLVDNTGNPLAAVQVRTASGWLSLARASYDYWIASSGAGAGPFTVRLTDVEGHQATVSGITLSPGTVQSTGTWMYGGGTAPTPSDSAPSLAATSAAPAAAATAAASATGSASPGGPAAPDSRSRTLPATSAGTTLSPTAPARSSC
jgi:expansin (peptidoglycan-binding protein)